MKTEKTYHSVDIEFKNGIIIGLWECLSEVIHWRKFNWNTYQFINIEFENDIMLGAYEFTFGLLCCGIRIRIPHETKKSKKEWEKIDLQMKKIDDYCYGWTNNREYTKFKNKQKWYLVITQKRENTKRKRIFIQ